MEIRKIHISQGTNDVQTHIATSKILYIETYDKKISDRFKLACKKGDSYTERILFWHKQKTHRETLIKDLYAYSACNEKVLYTKDELPDDYILEGEIVYIRPYIDVCYAEGKILRLLFNSTEEMQEEWKTYMQRFRKELLVIC